MATDESESTSTGRVNKNRVLVFASRGITHRDRHLLMDLRRMLPHSKTEPKMDTKDPAVAINEICAIRNCSHCIWFENRKRLDTYMWMSSVPRGPSVKCLVESVHTINEVKLTGNCLKGSRPILSFDPQFDKKPQYSLLKELFIQIFGTPKRHPKSQPFIDHVLNFTILDHRIWFRNYQIKEETGTLVEVGPRFVLNVIAIFDGSFGGPVLWSNPHYVSPNKHRAMMKRQAAEKYKERVFSKKAREQREPGGTAYEDLDQFDDIFQTIPPEEAKGIKKEVFKRKKV